MTKTCSIYISIHIVQWEIHTREKPFVISKCYIPKNFQCFSSFHLSIKLLIHISCFFLIRITRLYLAVELLNNPDKDVTIRSKFIATGMHYVSINFADFAISHIMPPVILTYSNCFINKKPVKYFLKHHQLKSVCNGVVIKFYTCWLIVNAASLSGILRLCLNSKRQC